MKILGYHTPTQFLVLGYFHVFTKLFSQGEVVCENGLVRVWRQGEWDDVLSVRDPVKLLEVEFGKYVPRYLLYNLGAAKADIFHYYNQIDSLDKAIKYMRALKRAWTEYNESLAIVKSGLLRNDPLVCVLERPPSRMVTKALEDSGVVATIVTHHTPNPCAVLQPTKGNESLFPQKKQTFDNLNTARKAAVGQLWTFGNLPTLAWKWWQQS
jgi:hypothetical protein